MVHDRIRAVTVLALVAVAWATPADATPCSGAALAAGTCTVGGGTTGDSVEVWGDATVDGDGEPTGGGAIEECPNVMGDRCVGESPPKIDGTPTTVHDIASFRPETPAQSSEPTAWTLRGVPTNFVSVASTHVLSGELLGADADVRFTPVSYARTFGDGRAATSTNPGATWRALGLPWWSRTGSSHNYTATGRFTVGLTVWYRAEFRFGAQEWRSLVGWVSARARPLPIAVLAADTVLVDGPCSPGGPGCTAALN